MVRRPPVPAQKATRPQQGRPVAAGSARAIKPRPATAKRPAAVAKPAQRPSAGRPSTASRPAGRAAKSPAGGVRMTGRPTWIRPSTVLGAVGVVLALMIFPSLRDWYLQRQELKAVRAEIVDVSREVDQLEKANQRWQDPDYLKIQARERLQYVMPGEVGLTAQGGNVDPVTGTSRTQLPNATWYDKVWDSMQVSAGINGADLSDQQLIDAQSGAGKG